MESLIDKLTDDQQRHIHDALAETTLKHIHSGGGLFQKLEYDRIAHPSQDLRNVMLPAVATSPEELDTIASFASARVYGYIKESLLTQGALMGVLKNQRGHKGGGAHVNVIGTHQSMPDIAYIEAAFSTAEHSLFTTDWLKIINGNGLVISRGVSTLQAFGLSAAEVVQKAGVAFLSFPRTDTINKLMLPGDILAENNKRMRDSFTEWLPTGLPKMKEKLSHPWQPLGHKRGFIAWSGSTDKVHGDNYAPDRVTLGRVHQGVLHLIKDGLVLPTVTWDRGPSQDPVFITGELTTVKKPEDISRVQAWQRDTLARALGITVTIQNS